MESKQHANTNATSNAIHKKPNYFLAFTIDDSEVLKEFKQVSSQLQEIQKKILLENNQNNTRNNQNRNEQSKINSNARDVHASKKLNINKQETTSTKSSTNENSTSTNTIPKGFTSENKIHCTLMVMNIPSEILESVKSEFQKNSKLSKESFMSNFEVQLYGIGNFKNSVIWMGFDKQSKEKLQSFVKNLRSFLENAQNNSKFSQIGFEDRDYFPHITIYKQTQKQGGKFSSSNTKEFVDPSNWLEFGNQLFGKQKVTRIELLEIGTTDEHGAYKQHAFLDLN